MDISTVISKTLAFREGLYWRALVCKAIGHTSPATSSMLFAVNSRWQRKGQTVRQ